MFHTEGSVLLGYSVTREARVKNILLSLCYFNGVCCNLLYPGVRWLVIKAAQCINHDQNLTFDQLCSPVTAVGCCPMNWHFYSSSCFFFSEEGMSWDSARDYCSSMSSSLVILKDEKKWNWVAQRTMPRYYWIGLTDERTGEWEWVDGTPYSMNRRQWKPGQPDDWTHHGLGGGEDCAHLHEDGRLNDDHCSRGYRFVCESSVMAGPAA